MDTKENAFDKIMDYEKNLHQKNQKRIKVGIQLLLVIPLIFLIIMFWTSSNKVIFLTFWIVSLFVIAIYLIAIEYMDYELQIKLREFGIRDEDDEIEGLIDDKVDVDKIIRVANAISDSFSLEDKNSAGSVAKLEDKSTKKVRATKKVSKIVNDEDETSKQDVSEDDFEDTIEESETQKDISSFDNTEAIKEIVDQIGVEAAEEELMASIKRYIAEVNKSDQPIIIEKKKTAEDYAEMRKRRAKERAKNDEQ